jgi:biotin carboxylase
MATRLFITDPYSGGVPLVEHCLASGIECHAVHSYGRDIPDVYRASYRPEFFASESWFDGDLERTVSHLGSLGIVAGIAGTESGVSLNDRLTEALGLPTNGSALSPVRRNKYLMIERLRAAGLPAADQLLCKSANEAAEWYRTSRHRRVVCKPLDSAGTDGVSFHERAETLRNAAASLLGTRHRLGGLNDAVVVQECLEGTEYVVDTVSCAGTHRVAAIWRYEKDSRGGAPVYKSVTLLPAAGKEQAELTRYAFGVLDALAIRFGAGHHEIMYTARGPVLVESAARPHGGTATKAAHACIGASQIDLTVDAYLNPERFTARTKEPYKLRKHARTVFLVALADGLILDGESADRIRRLPSCAELRLRVEPGGRVKRTVDLFSAPGWADLLAADPEELDRDEAEIRRLEATTLYQKP